MTVVVQPNVVTKNHTAGVQLGNLMLITENGAESLHACPVEFLRAGVPAVSLDSRIGLRLRCNRLYHGCVGPDRASIALRTGARGGAG